MSVPGNNAEPEEGAGHEPGAPVPKRGSGGLNTVVAENFDVWQAMGGVRGLAETVIPALLFVVVFLASGNLKASLAVPLGVSILAIVARLIQRHDVIPAISGLAGVGISVLWAYRSGEASSYFALGLLVNAAYLLALLVSVAVRWPLMGLVIGVLRGDATGWRNGPRAKEPVESLTRRRYYAITWLWIGLFALRIAVQAPLYAAKAVAPLGLARIVMGPFLFAFVAWLSWMMVRGLPPARTKDTPEAGEQEEV